MTSNEGEDDEGDLSSIVGSITSNEKLKSATGLSYQESGY